jgi:hypothetical protein
MYLCNARERDFSSNSLTETITMALRVQGQLYEHKAGPERHRPIMVQAIDNSRVGIIIRISMMEEVNHGVRSRMYPFGRHARWPNKAPQTNLGRPRINETTSSLKYFQVNWESEPGRAMLGYESKRALDVVSYSIWYLQLEIIKKRTRSISTSTKSDGILVQLFSRVQLEVKIKCLETIGST